MTSKCTTSVKSDFFSTFSLAVGRCLPWMERILFALCRWQQHCCVVISTQTSQSETLKQTTSYDHETLVAMVPCDDDCGRFPVGVVVGVFDSSTLHYEDIHSFHYQANDGNHSSIILCSSITHCSLFDSSSR